MAPATYGKTWWRDGYACGCMILLIEDVVEPRLRAAGYLSEGQQVAVYQQAYSSGVEASAGTHGGGGALDHQKGSDGETRIWRECGVADWQRGTPEDNAFDDHNHGIWQGCPHLSGDAAAQLDQYAAGCDGLAGWGPDDSPSVPPITWQDAYDKYADGGGGTDDEELFGMTNRISRYRGNAQTHSGDGWRQLATNDEGHPTISTNRRGMVDVILYITGGLARDEEVGFRWQYIGTKDDKANIDWQSAVIDHRSNGGTDRIQLVCHFDLPPAENGWDHKLRLAVNPGDGRTLTFGTIETRGWED